MNIKSILIIGSGISGLGAAHLAVRNNYKVFLTTLSTIDHIRKQKLLS